MVDSRKVSQENRKRESVNSSQEEKINVGKIEQKTVSFLLYSLLIFLRTAAELFSACWVCPIQIIER